MVRIKCSKCDKKCKGDVLKVSDNYYHKECFVCHVCNNSLDSSKFYVANNRLYCQKDIVSLKNCSLCGKELKGEVVSALNSSFHRSCFCCSQCHQNFNPGDKVSVHKNNYFCSNCIKDSLDKDKKYSQNSSYHKNDKSPLKNGKTSIKSTPSKNSTLSKNSPSSKHSPSSRISDKSAKNSSKCSLDIKNGDNEGKSQTGSIAQVNLRPTANKISNYDQRCYSSTRSHQNGATRESSINSSIPDCENIQNRKSNSYLSANYHNGNYSSRACSLNYNDHHPMDNSLITNGSKGNYSKRNTYRPKNFHIPEDRPRYRSMTLGSRETIHDSLHPRTPDTQYSIDHPNSSGKRAISPNLSQSTDRYLFNGQRSNTIHYYSKPKFPSNLSVKQKNGNFKTMLNDRNQVPIIISPMSGSVIVGSNDPLSEETIKLSSYPCGRERLVNEQAPIESQDWPGPPEPSVVMAEIMRQKRMTSKMKPRKNDEKNGMEKENLYPSKQSLLSKDESHEDLSLDASIDDSLGKNQPDQCPNAMNNENHPQNNFRRTNHWYEKLIQEFHTNGHCQNHHPCDLISQSRSPDARQEPPIQIRYRSHQYASPSRISYPRQSDRSDRSLNHSMDFVNLGNRHWSADLSQSSNRSHDFQNPKYFSSLVSDNAGYSNNSSINSILSRLSSSNIKSAINSNGHSRHPNGINNNSNGNNSARPQSRGSMFNSSTNSNRLANSLSGFPPLYEEDQAETTSNERTMESLDDLLARSAYTSGPSIPSVFYCSTPSAIFKKPAPISQKILPYEKLNLLNKNLPKGIDRTHLEHYLDEREFERLFKLTREQFGHLPEWKQNDLKRKVHLF